MTVHRLCWLVAAVLLEDGAEAVMLLTDSCCWYGDRRLRLSETQAGLKVRKSPLLLLVRKQRMAEAA